MNRSEWKMIEYDFPLVCRPAQASDTQDMLELTRNIWEGHDYVPRAWAAWLQDIRGRLLVAERKGKVLGIGKITCLSFKDWWLEGLRVHPDFQGQKIGSKLHESLLAAWEQIGDGTIRLITSYQRYPVHHLSERTGFQKIAELTVFTAPAVSSSVLQFMRVGQQDMEIALDFINRSASPDLVGRLVDQDWEWRSFGEEILELAIEEKRAWWWRDQRGLILVRIEEAEEDDGRPPALIIQLMACAIPDLEQILVDFRRLGAEYGLQKAGWVTSTAPDLISTLEDAGFNREWEGAIWLFAKTRQVESMRMV